MMQEIHDEAGYLFFFKARQRDLCIDAQTSAVNATQTQTRLAEGSTILLKGPTWSPFPVLKMDGEEKDVVVFKALEDISVDTQLKFDYGVKSKSFRGVDLDWLAE